MATVIPVQPPTYVISDNAVGNAIFNLFIQLLTWFAFGALVCGGWHFMEYLISKF